MTSPRSLESRSRALARAAVAADRELRAAGMRLAALEAHGLRQVYAVDGGPGPAKPASVDPVESFFDDDARDLAGHQPGPKAIG